MRKMVSRDVLGIPNGPLTVFPCSIKREIGHLCCDEVVPTSGSNDDPSTASVPPSTGSKPPHDPTPHAHAPTHRHHQPNPVGGPDIHEVILPPPASSATSTPMIAGSFDATTSAPGSTVATTSLPANFLAPQAQALLQQGEPSVSLGASGGEPTSTSSMLLPGPETSLLPVALRNPALRTTNALTNATLPPTQNPSGFFGSGFSFSTPSDPFGLELGVGVGGMSTYPPSSSSPGDAGFGGSLGSNEFSGLALGDFLKSLDDTSFFNTDALLDHYTGGSGASSMPLVAEQNPMGPIAGSSTISPSFLGEDLSGLGGPTSTKTNGELDTPAMRPFSGSGASSVQPLPSPSAPVTSAASLAPATSLAAVAPTHAATSSAAPQSRPQHHHKHKSGTEHNADPSADPTNPADKTERFLLTAADQKDGSRDERLAKVIHAKFEAGLLKPYNYVAGYTRLMRWMEQKCVEALVAPLSPAH